MADTPTPPDAGVQPCPICGGPCKRFPDLPTDPNNPFLGAKPTADPKPAPVKRPKGKRHPAEDRARRPSEDRGQS